MGIFESLLTCGDRRDEELSLNRDSTSPTSPSDDCSSPEDEEVIMNFLEGYQSSGSAEEMTAIQGVENLSLEQCRSVTPECVSETALKRATPPRSHTNVFKQAVATLVNQEPIRTIFKSEPIQSEQSSRVSRSNQSSRASRSKQCSRVNKPTSMLMICTAKIRNDRDHRRFSQYRYICSLQRQNSSLVRT